MAGDSFGKTFPNILPEMFHYTVNFCSPTFPYHKIGVLFSYKLEVENKLVLPWCLKHVRYHINFKLSEIFKTQSTSKYIFRCYYLKIILITTFFKVRYILDVSNINKYISLKRQ